MSEFHDTGYGRKFYERDVPRLVEALERIADALDALKPKPSCLTCGGPLKPFDVLVSDYCSPCRAAGATG